MRILFNWQIIRRPIKDAKSGGGVRDTTSKRCRVRIQLCKRSGERTPQPPRSPPRAAPPATLSALLLIGHRIRPIRGIEGEIGVDRGEAGTEIENKNGVVSRLKRRYLDIKDEGIHSLSTCD
ncbi:hypothetical protein EVAR_43487_1 [Eumeta japonica]|uniref:Uncharacterized protein n=1 Tax=Eumeta variegata TaxID=151549 RepID=A0A4C1YGT1_EUMVA|nr:hypothetical protein EVAR_43487_1 [Eumeta japonica]